MILFCGRVLKSSYLHCGLALGVAACVIVVPVSHAKAKVPPVVAPAKKTLKLAGPDQPKGKDAWVKLSFDGSLDGLVWSSDPVELKKTKGGDGRPQFTAILKGTFSQPNTDLLWGTHKIASTRDQVPVDVTVELPLIRSVTQVKVRSVNERGKLQGALVQVSVADFKRLMMDSRDQSPWRLSASLGYTTVSYFEIPPLPAPSIEIAMTGLTAKVASGYQLSDSWDLALSTYLTAFELSSTNANPLRFLGVNFRVGHQFGFLPEPWFLSIMIGGYYTTMFVANNAFGFTNMSGPQLFPVLKYRLSSKDFLIAYFKYSPIMSGFGFLSLAQRELASGLTYARMTSPGHSLTASFDFANLVLDIPDLTGALTAISSTSMSFSVGYTW